MAALIQRIGRLAVQTFNRDASISVQMKRSYLKQLEDLLTSLSSTDLGIENVLLQVHNEVPLPVGSNRTRAPAIYLKLYEDSDVNVCIFVLRTGVRMPLHDHPGMFGLLKVVHGDIKVQRYTLLDASGTGTLKAAKKLDVVQKSSHEPPLSLSPESENIHEIETVDGPAAFLDILSPPYGPDTRLGIERECNYYREVCLSSYDYLSELDQHKTWLELIDSPIGYWCEEAEYRGPPLKGVIERGKSSWRRYLRRGKSSGK